MREQLAQAAKPKTKGPDPSSAAGLAEAAQAEKANSAVAKVKSDATTFGPSEITCAILYHNSSASAFDL